MKSVGGAQAANKYDIAELFSPPGMIEMAEAYGLKGGWPRDDKCTYPMTGLTYDQRNKKDQNEVRKMIRRDRPLALTASPPSTRFSIANHGANRPEGICRGSR